MRMFEKDGDYKAFEQVMVEACERIPMPILSYCVMPNHIGGAGSGHLYQGRFKSFVVEENEHLLTMYRYVKRNALRAS